MTPSAPAVPIQARSTQGQPARARSTQARSTRAQLAGARPTQPRSARARSAQEQPAQQPLPIPTSMLRPRRVTQAALDLLGQARAGLDEAARLPVATERYAAAHLAALRATAAVLAGRARAEGAGVRRRRLRSAWELLTEVAPEMAEWAAFFAAGAAKRAAAEAGVTRAVTPREADDLVRDVETFLALVLTTLGAPSGAPPQRRALDSGRRRALE